MKKYIFLIVATCGLALSSQAQIGYGTNNPDPRAVIELNSTDKAFYLPRLTTTQLNAQTGWKEGMMVYNTDSNCVYFRGDTDWECVGTGSAGGTDDQKIDTLSLQGDTLLQISLEGDGEVAQTVDLSALKKDGDAWGVTGEDETSSIARTGKVAIGTNSTSSEFLEVYTGTSTSAPGILLRRGSANNPVGVFMSYGTNAKTVGIQADRNMGGANNGGLQLIASNSRPIQFYTKMTSSGSSIYDVQEAARFSGNGNFGIGTTSPSTKLHVEGDARITTMPVGNSSDSVVVVDADGNLKKVSASSLATQEPWFGTDDNAAATDNTEDIYFMGNIAVGQDSVGTGKVATFAGDVDVKGVLDPTKLIFSGDGSIGSFNPISSDSSYQIEFQEDLDLTILSNNHDSIMHFDNDGKIGIGTNNPVGILDMASVSDKAVRYPQISLTSRKDTTNIDPLLDGMVVFNTNESGTGVSTTNIDVFFYQSEFSSIISTNNRTNFELKKVVLDSIGFNSSLSDRTFTVLTTANNTDTSGVVPSTVSVIGNLKSYYWFYLIEEDKIKAVKIEFKLDGNDLQMRYTKGREREGTQVVSSDRNDDYFSRDPILNSDVLSIYSLRKTTSTYSGDAIRVRRSSDSTETNVGFTSTGDLDESALTTFVGTGDGFVSTWYDQSGSGRDISNSTLNRQPKIVSSGTVNKLGGRPIIEFDNSVLFRSANTSEVNNEFSVFLVCRIIEDGTYGRFFQYGGKYMRLEEDKSNNNKIEYHLHGTPLASTSASYTFDSHDQMTFTAKESGKAKFYLNGTSFLTEQSTDSWGAQTPTRLTLGANRAFGNFSKIGYQEVIFFKSVLADTHQDNIEELQDDYWKNNKQVVLDWHPALNAPHFLELEFDSDDSPMFKGHFVWNEGKKEWNPKREIRKDDDPSGNNLSADVGELMWDTSDDELQVWNGNIWETIKSSHRARLTLANVFQRQAVLGIEHGNSLLLETNRGLSLSNPREGVLKMRVEGPWYSTTTKEVSGNVDERIYHLGNVGISEENPRSFLHINNGDVDQSGIIMNSNSNETARGIYFTYNNYYGDDIRAALQCDNTIRDYGQYQSGLQMMAVNKRPIQFMVTEKNLLSDTEEVMRIHAEPGKVGWVGIGTRDPEAKLHLEGNLIVTEMLIGNTSDTLVVVDTTGLLKKLPLDSIGDGDAWGVAGEDETSSIARTGKVAIGTNSTPQHVLDVVGSTSGTSTVIAAIGPMTGSSNPRLYLQAGNNVVNLNSRFNHPLVLSVNNTEKMRVTTGGNVGIGITAPTEKLHVSGNILATGTITPNSDQRLKDKISIVENGLSKVLKMRGVHWNWKNPKNHGNNTGRVSGVIAQELQQLAPELIFQQKDEIGTLSVNYNGLSAYFIEAIKEQQEQLDKKDKEIKTLKSTLDQLLKRVEKLELK